MPYTPIIATLGFVLSPDHSNVLMIHRNRRPDDIHWGKYNGLGGKLEANEDVLSGLQREIHEEAGIDCQNLCLRGTISWPGFGKKGEDWFGFIFLISSFLGTPKTSNPEGSLVWVQKDELLKLPMWEGDRLFIPLVFDNDPRPFHGIMPYHNQQNTGWTVTRL